MNASVGAGAHGTEAASEWVRRFAALIPDGARVLDLACGYGRHTRYLAQLSRGLKITAVDRDPAAIASLAEVADVDARLLDLEGDSWPFASEHFDAVIVTNYLWRPYLDALLALVCDDGLLLYETFAAGNEAFGKPSRADFLLQPNELLARVRNRLQIVAFEQGEVATPKRAVIQRIAAVGAARPWPIQLPD